MNAVHFTTVVGPDGVIYPPAGVALPQGEIEVQVRFNQESAKPDDDRLRQLCTRRGLNWSWLSVEDRGRLVEDLEREDRGLPPPRPEPGLFKGSILYMAPDFDAPLDDMKEYME